MLITVPFRHLCVRSFGVGGKCDCSGLRGNRGTQSSTPPVWCASRTGAHMLLLTSLISHSRQQNITPLTWPTGAGCACARARACVHPCLGAFVFFPEWHQRHVLLIKDIMHTAEKARWQWSEFRLYNPPDLAIPTLWCSHRYAGKPSQRRRKLLFLLPCRLWLILFCGAFCLSFNLRFSCGWRSVYLESVRQFATFSSFKLFLFF